MQQLKPIGYSLQPTLKLATIIQLEPKYVQLALQIYKKLFPSYLGQKHLTHIKIINKVNEQLQLFLGLEQDSQEMLQSFKQLCDFDYTITQQLIPINTPIDKIQVTKWQEYWAISNTIQITFPATIDHDATQIGILMRLVIDRAKIQFEQGYRSNACILYNANKIILEASDKVVRASKNSKTQHSVMILLEKLAQTHQKDSLQPTQIGMKTQQEIDPESAYEESFQDKQYLAKDLSLIIAQEPCVMCSMALVHSRIKVVYYSYKNQDLKGGLNHSLQICDMVELNHKYIVYHGVELDYAKIQLLELK